MHRRHAGKIIAIAGIALTAIQVIFGFSSIIIASHTDGKEVFAQIGGRNTAHGAVDGLVTFGLQALVAGTAAILLAAVALFLIKEGRWPTLSGLLFILAGTVNSIVLFSAGLPAGVVLMGAGMAALIRKPGKAV
ncbi:hypothetical protein [Sporolactobacillus pectinivorans]|uniref:hypothetical protein n=1 Tax=Sporolactobacillus pectinivorans TaxID=1591408 RepID=UPI000C260DBC|nr:hypothetical protein [Sporolactobacillus pectinivorans]